MINQQYKEMLNARSPIRSFSEYATKRAKEIGYENVFDYSLGNPSQSVPDAYTKHTIDVLNNIPSNELHGYSPTLGLPSYKEKIAQSLNSRLYSRTYFSYSRSCKCYCSCNACCIKTRG
ncbi:MAG: hypothetical protein LUF02_06670 [Erysipelotrichaceae bacterium]|nr:hypothetical protein [Erysipelotrichaceae bacterium]